MFCKKCGTELNDNSVFCHKCGERLIEENEIQILEEKKEIEPVKTGIAVLQFVFAIIAIIIGMSALFTCH